MFRKIYPKMIEQKNLYFLHYTMHQNISIFGSIKENYFLTNSGSSESEFNPSLALKASLKSGSSWKQKWRRLSWETKPGVIMVLAYLTSVKPVWAMSIWSSKELIWMKHLEERYSTKLLERFYQEFYLIHKEEKKKDILRQSGFLLRLLPIGLVQYHWLPVLLLKA